MATNYFKSVKNSDLFNIGILYAVFSFIPIFVIITLVYILLKDRDLRQNPSYMLMARLLICDFLQTLAHVLTGFFIIFPNLQKVEFLIRLAGCDVTVIWLMSYPLVCELSIFRALVVTGKTDPNKLPLVLWFVEGVFWCLLVVDFIFCWTNRAVYFHEIYWDNDKKRLFGQVANILEVYFGLPALLIGYTIYIITLIHVMSKKRQYRTGSDIKQEMSLFVQTSCESFYCAFLVILWHTQDVIWPDMNDWGGFLTDLCWIFYFYWKSALLLAFNRTVRNKWLFHIFSWKGKDISSTSFNKMPRGSIIPIHTRMTLSYAEIGAIFLHTLSNVIGLTGNGLLLYLVVTHTPKSIRIYSILIFNFAVTDFCGCSMAIFVQQRLIPVGTSLAYISSGPCKYFGSLVCYISYSVMLHCYAHTLWSLLLSFLYRFYVLISRALNSKQVICLLLIVYSISFFQFITFSFASDSPDVMLTILRKRFPDYELDGHVISGNENIFEWKALFTILHMTLPVSPVYCTIVWIRQKIIRTLQGHRMSENTKTMHRQLLNALTFQAILPGLFLIAVITYALGQTGIYNHPILEYTTFISVGILPVISPLGTLYFIRPYQNWIRQKILRQRVVHPAPTVYSATNAMTSATNYRV